MSISLLRKLLMKEAVKDTAGSSGIMSINKNIAAKVEQQVQRYVNDAMRQGVDLDTLSPEQLKMIVQMNKPKPPRVIAGDSPEGRAITEKLLGKRGEVVDMAGKKLDTSQGIMGGKSVKELMDSGQVTKGARGMKKSKKIQDREMFQGANKRLKTEAQLKKEIEANNKKGIAGIKINLVDDSISKIKSMEPIEAMKEANLVAGKKGRYANLDDNQVKKIMDDTQEHIFQDSSPLDDYATGGRAGFKGGGLTESDYLKVKDMLNHYFDYRKSGGTLSKTKFANAFFRENNADGGVAGLLGERPGYRSAGFISGRTKSSKSNSSTNQGPAGGASAGGNYGGNVNPNQTYGGGGGGNNNTGGGGGGGPPGANTGGGTTTTTTNVPSNFREILKQRQILKNLGLIDEEDLALSGASKVGKSLYSIFKSKPDKPGFNVNLDKLPNFDINYFNKNYLKDSSSKYGLKLNLKDAVEKEINPEAYYEKKFGNKTIKGILGEDKLGVEFSMPFGKQPPGKVGPRNFKDRFAPDISKFNFEDLTGITSTVPDNIKLAKTFNTKKDLQNLGAAKDSFFDTLTPQGKALEKFRNSAVNFKKAEQNTANTPQAALDFMQNKPGLFSDVLDNQEFIQNAIDKGFLKDESDYANQLPLGEAVDLADGGPARQNFKMGKRAFLKAMLGTGAGIAGLKTGLIGMGGKEATKKAVTETVKSAGSGYPPPYFFKLVDKIKFMGDDVTQKAATQERQSVKRYKDYEMTEDLGTGDIVIKKRNEGSFYDQDGIISDEYIVYKPGQADELTKGKKPPPEYDEYTVRPDADGKLRDSEDGLDSIDEILEEVGDPDSMTLKKASGGIARMLGE